MSSSLQRERSNALIPVESQPLESEGAEDGDGGYVQSLGRRQVQMIAIGGAVGVGLFLGTGGLLRTAGPALVLCFVICGVVAFFVLRALSELIAYRPTSGSFVEYAREFIGPWAGFATGWMYWLNWAMAGIAEITAVGIYAHRWLPDIPQWITALAALLILLTVNLLSVKIFGELEFWFSLIKVTAIVIFLFVAVALIFTATDLGHGEHATLTNLTDHGGLFPSGVTTVILTLQAVLFSYASTELVGVAAGETRNARQVLPKAINGVLWRIALFYIGSVLLLVVVLPWTAYSSGESPFVTVFSRLGVPAAGDIMNAIVLIAALSSCNSGLYATGRILRALADRKEAPRLAGRLSPRHVPSGAIIMTATMYLLGVGLNLLVPHKAFAIAISIASLGIVITWATVIWCQIRLRRTTLRKGTPRPAYRMPGSPVTSWLTLGFLGLVVALMAFGSPAERYAFWAIPFLAIALALGWRIVSKRRAAPVHGGEPEPVTPPRSFALSRQGSSQSEQSESWRAAWLAHPSQQSQLADLG